MNNEVITIEKEKCAHLAERYFLLSSGLDRETEKNANVRESACRVRTKIEDMLSIRAVFSFCDAPAFDGKVLEISGQRFMCDPFEQIGSGEVKAALPFFITAGDIRTEDMQVSDQVMADLWANAYLQAAVSVFREHLEKQYGKLSSQFGPGLYGMSEGSARRLARLADMREIGISLNEKGLMVPAKSCCGLFFTVKDTYEDPDTECLYCRGKAGGCAGCSVLLRRKRKENIIPGLPADFSPDKGKTGLGIAVDIGTTSLAVLLWDMSCAKLLAAVSDQNPQRDYGADVITRLVWVSKQENGLERMRKKVLSGINSLIDKACASAGVNSSDLCKAVAAGNTVMSHFFAGADTAGLEKAPFTPAYHGLVRMTGAKAGLHAAGEAEVLLVPNIAGHVGGDITSGIIATGISEDDKTSLFIDIGTNGEIVLMSEGKGLTCSAAAGPAFEGAGISCGMRASRGAIERLQVKDGEIHMETVEGADACGICGSGLIDAVSYMLKTGLMDSNGKIFDREFRFPEAPDIYISQKDVRHFQLAKGAIAAGTQICLEEMVKKAEDIDRIYIGGAFGSSINRESAMKTGLIPETDMEKVSAAGNTSGLGASMILLSAEKEHEAERIPEIIRHIELAEKEGFQKVFLDKMDF